jgi:hypothetical protein
MQLNATSMLKNTKDLCNNICTVGIQCINSKLFASKN